MNGVRTFDFDPSVSRAEAIRLIVAALDDEGLVLTDNDNSTFGGITTVLVDGVKRVLVPAHRITAARTTRPTLEVLK